MPATLKIVQRAAFGAAFALSGLAGCATSPDPPGSTPSAWLRGADCLDPSSARSWEDVSTTEILVDAGRRKYRMTLPASCMRIGAGPVLVFDGDPIGGRVCGVPSDAVRFDDGQRCTIERLELIDAETYRAEMNATDGEVHAEAPVR